MRCLSRANQANTLRPLGVRDHQQPLLAGFSHENKAVLFDRMIGVRENDKQRVIERRGGFVKTDIVLLEIRLSLMLAPLESSGYQGRT